MSFKNHMNLINTLFSHELKECHIDYDPTSRVCTLLFKEALAPLVEKALPDIQALDCDVKEWIIKFRPDTEILTKEGYIAPPPTREEIIRQCGIHVFRLETTNDLHALTVESTDRHLAHEAVKRIMDRLGDPFTSWSLKIIPSLDDALDQYPGDYKVEYEAGNCRMVVPESQKEKAETFVKSLEILRPIGVSTYQDASV